MRPVVWKFRVSHNRPVKMPKGAKVIAVGSSGSPPMPHVWAEVDAEAEWEERNILFFGTGRPLPPNRVYFGSVHIDVFVWHIYEVDA